MATKMNPVKLTSALLIAMVIGLALYAAPVSAEPPGFGGAGGGTILIDLPGEAEWVSGTIGDQNGAIVGIDVEWWYQGELVVSSVTDYNGQYELTPPGFGGAGGGTIQIHLPEDTTLAEGTALLDGGVLSNAQVQWFYDEEVIASQYTGTTGDYLMEPPGWGGQGGGTS